MDISAVSINKKGSSFLRGQLRSKLLGGYNKLSFFTFYQEALLALRSGKKSITLPARYTKSKKPETIEFEDKHLNQ